MKVIAVIPAHLASVRFPRKILNNFFGLPMIEHVRRRALLSKSLHEVYVATSDSEIIDVVEKWGGKVLITEGFHINGTSRVSEAVKNIDCTHVILLQGDEPLLLPRHIEEMVKKIKEMPGGLAWNAVGPIEDIAELDRHSFVKCAIGVAGNILMCFRKSPLFGEMEAQEKVISKILGIIAFKKDFLLQLTEMKTTPMEESQSIEQMRIIENGYTLISVKVNPSLPSVNEPFEADIVRDYLSNSHEQQELLASILHQGV